MLYLSVNDDNNDNSVVYVLHVVENIVVNKSEWITNHIIDLYFIYTNFHFFSLSLEKSILYESRECSWKYEGKKRRNSPSHGIHT